MSRHIESRSSYFTSIIPAILIVAAQIACYPILTQLYGHNGFTEFIILTTVFASIAIGQLNVLSQRLISLLSLITGIFLILFGLFLSHFIFFFVQNSLYRYSLTAILILFIFLSGQFLLIGTYNKNRFHQNYTYINFFAFLTVIGAILLLVTTGFSSAFIVIGILLCFLSFKNTSLYSELPQKSLQIDRESIKSITFGFISAGFISCYFRIIYLGIYPTGYEFNIYLALSFLFLSLVSIFYTKKKNPFSTQTIVLSGLLLSILCLFFYFSGPNPHTFYIDPLRIFFAFPSFLRHFWFHTLGFCTFFLIPYIFFAGIIPSREIESKNINHLFFCSIGNVLGFFIFSFILLDFEMKSKYIILSFIILILNILNIKKTTKYTLIVSLLLLIGCFFLPSNLDQRIVTQGQRMFQSFWINNTPNQKASLNIKYDTNSIKHMTTKHGQTGYFFKDANFVRLGFGGYSTKINSALDLQKAMTVRDLISKKTDKILILGLGNQIVLQQAYAKLKYLNKTTFQIDVVDNFHPFYDKTFKSILDTTLGFSSQKPEIKIHNIDAMQFLLKNNDHTYDIVVWNLTQPHYPASAKLYTKEGSLLVANTLKPDGIFVNKNYDNAIIDCTLVSAFKYFSSFPSKSFNRFNSLIASNSPLKLNESLENRPFELASYCKNQTPITLNSYTKLFKAKPYQFRTPTSTTHYQLNDQLLKTSASAQLFNSKVTAQESTIAIVPLTGPEKININQLSNIIQHAQDKFKNYPLIIDSLSSSILDQRYTYILQRHLFNKSIHFIPKNIETNLSDKIVNILLATDLSGNKSKSARHIKNAIELYTHLNNEMYWKLNVLDSQSDEILNAKLTHQLYLTADKNTILFAPRGSIASQKYIDLYSSKKHKNDNFYFLNQVTASSKFNKKHPALSSFLPSEKYLHGMLELMQKTLGNPEKIHIARLEGIPYFSEIEKQVKADISRLGLTLGKMILLKKNARDEILSFFKPESPHSINPDDWLILLDYGPIVFKNLNIPSEQFARITKVFTYGHSQPFKDIDRNQQHLYKNSWHSIFWNKHLNYQQTESLNNCDFSIEYENRFGQSPDFHAAYTYAALQLTNALGNKNPFTQKNNSANTILGKMKWDHQGIRTNAAPLILYYDKDGSQTLYTQKKHQWCFDTPKDEIIPIKLINSY